MSEKDRPNRAIWVAIIAGALTLCGTITSSSGPSDLPIATTETASLPAPTPPIARVVSDGPVYVRQGPCLPIIATFRPGTEYAVTGRYTTPEGQDWWRIKLYPPIAGFSEGWIQGDLVEVTGETLVPFFLAQCKPFATPPPTETTSPVITSTASPVELAALNVWSEAQSDGSIKKMADLSMTALGLGSLQITSPSVIKLGESSVIRLTIAPASALIALPSVSISTLEANDLGYVLEFSDRLQIDPVMIAELKGVNFDIVSDGYPEKPVTSSEPVTWRWNVTPKSGGKQVLFLVISIPVLIDQTGNSPSAQLLKNVSIEIEMEAADTSITLSSRIREQLVENVTAIVVAVLSLIGVLGGVYVTYQNNQKSKVVAPTTKRKPRKK